jgi:hypothetical protein
MKLHLFGFTLLSITVMAAVAPASAQAIRTYVSITGNDSNPCSLTQPCRHFQAAVDLTSDGGEVDALDPGGYGSFTIIHAITIDGEGWSYVAPPTHSAAITINAGTNDKIVIRGVSFNGIGVANADGIDFDGGSLTIRDCVIRNFTGSGINFGPTSSSSTQFNVSNTLVSDNGFGGINIEPANGGSMGGVLSHVDIESNVGAGLTVESSNPVTNITVTDSVASNNTGVGIMAADSGGIVNVMVRDSTIANNGSDGLDAASTGTTIRVTRSTITGNATGWTNTGGATVLSYGDNNIDGNGSVNTAPPCVNGSSPCSAYK